MIYAALAAVLVAGLCWDFGRRWLVHYERGVEAALIRTQENAMLWEVDRDRLNDRCDDIQTTLNLRVRELGDRVDALSASDLTRVRELGIFEDQLNSTTGRVCELEQKRTPDMSKHDAAVINLGKQLQELSLEVTKLKAGMAGRVATGRPLAG